MDTYTINNTNNIRKEGDTMDTYTINNTNNIRKEGDTMDTYTITCPRCNGDGIFYTRVYNGRPVPAQPDNGVCYRCNGAGIIGKINIRKEGKDMKNDNTNKTLNYIKGHIAIYSEIPFSREEQLKFLSKDYLLLDNSGEQPVLAYNNPYYGRINPQTGEPNPKYTKESKSLHTLLWKILLNRPAVMAFRYFDFSVNITPNQSIKDFVQYALTNGIKVQLHDLTLDYKIVLQPVQSNGQMQAAYWELLNEQLSEYNKLLEEHYQLRLLESYIPVPLQYYLGPDADTALDYILTWASAYELDINFPITEPETKLIAHKNGTYSIFRDHFNDPKYYSRDMALLYNQLKYYELILEPISNPANIICNVCGHPVYIYDQSAIAPTSVYYEALGNSGYYLEKAHQVICQHCFNTFIYDPENDEYTLITKDYEENLIITNKLNDPSNTKKAEDWWNRPLQPINTSVKKILPDLDIFMEILQAMQETYPTLTLRQAIEKTNMHYWAIYYNKIA